MAHKRRDYKKKMSETTLIIIKEEKRPTKGAKFFFLLKSENLSLIPKEKVKLFEGNTNELTNLPCKAKCSKAYQELPRSRIERKKERKKAHEVPNTFWDFKSG
jgi:hypothetical protein